MICIVDLLANVLGVRRKTGMYLLLDVLADLVVHLELLLEFVKLLLVNVASLNRLLGWRRWRGEEVEERLCGARLADETRPVRV